jgi:hypothetical protein
MFPSFLLQHLPGQILSHLAQIAGHLKTPTLKQFQQGNTAH